MFCTFLVLAFQSESIFVIKVDLIVSCFETYEFLLYATLISRRVQALQSAFNALLVTGIVFYFLTRLAQLAILIGLFVLSYGPMQATSKTKALYWVSMVLCVALIFLQSYTFVIYYNIWKSTNRKLLCQEDLPTHVTASSASCQFVGFRPRGESV